MASSCQVFRACSVLYTDDCFRNHFPSTWANDMSSQYSVSFLIGKDFNHTISIRNSFGSGVSKEWENASVKFNTFLFQLLFCLSDWCYFWISIDDWRNSIVIDMARLICNLLGYENSFFFGLMGKHGSSNNITNSPDVRYAGFQMIINNNSSFVIKLNSCIVGLKTISVGSSSCGN